MARARKVPNTEVKVDNIGEVVEAKNELIEVSSKYYSIHLPNHVIINFEDGIAKVTKEQYDVLKKMGVI